MTTFSEFLQSEMDERGWSQADLARASGLSDKNVSEYVKKSVVPRDPDKLKGIAKGLELPVNVVRAAAKAAPDEDVFRLSPERKADARTLTTTQSEAIYEMIRLLADGNRKAVTGHEDSSAPIDELAQKRAPDLAGPPSDLTLDHYAASHTRPEDEHLEREKYHSALGEESQDPDSP